MIILGTLLHRMAYSSQAFLKPKNAEDIGGLNADHHRHYGHAKLD